VIKPVPEYHQERVAKPEGKKFTNAVFSETRDHVEKKHMPEKAAQTKTTYDHQKPKRVCFETHNKPTFNEHGVETNMQKKARVNDLAAQRGNLPLASLGDKNYKDVAYEPGFFLAGGLIPGSTNKVH